ncbi:MAG: hypothetical protein ACJATI_002872 [Halioglobus sp.]|jgi:hypothetical protein
MKCILSIFILSLLSIPAWSQSVIASGGQAGSNNNLSASATIGESIIGSNSIPGLSSNQGFQQPLQSDISTSIFDINGQMVDVLIAPNPVRGQLKITLSKSFDDINIMIYTSTGILVTSNHYHSSLSIIEDDISDLKSGAYYIGINDRNGHRLVNIPIIKI